MCAQIVKKKKTVILFKKSVNIFCISVEVDVRNTPVVFWEKKKLLWRCAWVIGMCFYSLKLSSLKLPVVFLLKGYDVTQMRIQKNTDLIVPC